MKQRKKNGIVEHSYKDMFYSNVLIRIVEALGRNPRRGLLVSSRSFLVIKASLEECLNHFD
jgi:hypothetical protein